jgi:hypothetical protein
MRVAIILDRDLGGGYAANAAAVLAMSIGKRYPELVGGELADRDGNAHPGITSVPIPILAVEAAELPRLREAAMAEGGLWTVDFTHAARAARDYGTYERELATLGGTELRYVGIAIAGEKAELKRLTGSLPLFR